MPSTCVDCGNELASAGRATRCLDCHNANVGRMRHAESEDDDRALLEKSKTLSVSDLARSHGVSRQTIYNRLARAKARAQEVPGGLAVREG